MMWFIVPGMIVLIGAIAIPRISRMVTKWDQSIWNEMNKQEQEKIKDNKKWIQN